MFNVNDIYERLQKGEKIESIGNEIADMMNKAQEMYAADQALAEKAASKRELMETLINTVKELCILEGAAPEDVEINDEDIDRLVESFESMFAAVNKFNKIAAKVENNSDEQILANFIKMFY